MENSQIGQKRFKEHKKKWVPCNESKKGSAKGSKVIFCTVYYLTSYNKTLKKSTRNPKYFLLFDFQSKKP